MEDLRRLHENIEGYLKRFYLSKLIAGGLITLGVALALGLIVALVEYVYRLNTTPRMVLFFGFVLMVGGVLVSQVLRPWMQYLGWFRNLGEPDAAKAIGKAIPDIDDRLLNAISLGEGANAELKLVQASLTQRAGALNLFDFREAVDLRESLKWVRWTAIPVVVLFAISLWDARVLTDSAGRIIQYDEQFIPPAPFRFEILNADLSVVEGKAFELKVLTEGEATPNNVFVEMDQAQFRMKKGADGQFSYTFNNVRNDIPFRLRGASVYSQPLSLKVLSQPKVLESRASMDYPAYTGKQDEQMVNRSKLVVPEGTSITWLMSLKDVESPEVLIGDELAAADVNSDNLSFSGRFLESNTVRLRMRSPSAIVDSNSVEVVVVKDEFPVIQVDSRVDTARMIFYFNGDLEDDYGFSRLRFAVENEQGQVLHEEDIQIYQNMTEQAFIHAFPADSLLKVPGDEITYYLQVWDNDAINGAKSSSTRKWTCRAPTREELKEENQEQFEQTKKSLTDEEKALQDMQEKLKDVRKDLLEKKMIDWEDKEALKKLLDDRKEMMEKLQKKAEQQRQQMERSNKFNPYSEELLEKQQMIQEMFEKLFDDDFKEKYEEYNRLLEELNKQQMLDKLDEMELDNEKLEKEMDRTLELFKQLEFEQSLEERTQELEELIKDQEELQEKTEGKEEEASTLQEEQQDLQGRLDDFEKNMEDLEGMNETLEDRHEMPDLSEPMDDAEQSMKEAKEQLQRSNENKAGEQQQKAKEKMKEMQESLSQFQQSMSQEQQTENLENMRQLLENIVQLSKDQEHVMETLKPLRGNDPKYVEYAKRQKELMDDTRIVEDSLLALSKRVPQIDKKINDEVADVKFNMEKALDNLTNQPPNQEQRYKAMAAERQQISMTALNNLALLFDEIIKNMQQQMQSSMKGSGQCNKPGQGQGSKPSAAEMRALQKAMNQQLQKLKDAMEKGNNPNGKQPGQSSGMGMGSMSKELARLAAEQAALRKQLRQMSESMEKGGQVGSAKELMESVERMMEQTEEDLLYQNITSETMRRQQEIITKLLESEKADRERELDNKRESKSADNNYQVPTEVWEEFEKKRERELELYRTVPANLKPFYRNQVNRYFSNFQD